LHRHQLQQIGDSLKQMPVSLNEQPFALCAKGQILLEQHQKDSAAVYFNKALAITREKDPVILSAIVQAHQASKAGVQ
jgi:hypothetical protein